MNSIQRKFWSYQEQKIFHTLRINVKSIGAELRHNRIERFRIKSSGGEHASLLIAEILAHGEYLRRIARYANLAYAAVRGRNYSDVERRIKADNKPAAAELQKKFDRFGVGMDAEKWLKT